MSCPLLTHPEYTKSISELLNENKQHMLLWAIAFMKYYEEKYKNGYNFYKYR